MRLLEHDPVDHGFLRVIGRDALRSVHTVYRQNRPCGLIAPQLLHGVVAKRKAIDRVDLAAQQHDMRFRVPCQNLRRADGIGHDAKALAHAERLGHAQRGRAGIEKQRIAVLNVRKRLGCNGALLRGKRVRSGLLHRRLYRLRRDSDRAAGNTHESIFCRHRVQIRSDGRLRRV